MTVGTDPCVANPPSPDNDADGWSAGQERYIGTDLVDDCPDDPSDDAWPPDINIDTIVNVLDVAKFRPYLFGRTSCCTSDVGCFDRRHDLDANTCVNVLDVVKLKPDLWKECTNP